MWIKAHQELLTTSFQVVHIQREKITFLLGTATSVSPDFIAYTQIWFLEIEFISSSRIFIALAGENDQFGHLLII